MKNTLVFLLWFIGATPIFSQDVKRDASHGLLVQIKPAKKQRETVMAPITDLLLDLQKPMGFRTKIELLFSISSGYLNKLKIDSALFYAEKIKLLSDSAGYEPGVARYYLARGSALFYRNQGDEVKANLQKAIGLFAKQKDSLYLGISYHQLARQLGNTSDYAGAQRCYQQAVPLIAASGDLNRLQWAIHNYGRNFFFRLELDSSIYYLSLAVKLAEEIKNDSKIFNSATMLGAVYLISDNLKEAEQTLAYAIAIRPGSVDKVQLRGVWADYSEVFILQDKFDAAAKAIMEYDKLNTMFGDVAGQMTEKKLKGIFNYRQGKYEPALQFLKEAFQLRTEDELFAHELMSIASHLGKTELKIGQTDSAITHFRIAYQLANQVNYMAGILDAGSWLAEAFQQNRESDSAYHYFKNYSYLRDSILTFKKEKVIMELSARYDAERKEQQIKHLEADQKILAYQIALKNKTIDEQFLLDVKKSQQLTLLTQQAEIGRLQASEKNLAMENREKELVKKQNELELLQKERQLQSALTAKEAQQKKLLFIITGAILLFVVFGIYRYRQNKNLSDQLSRSLVELKVAQEQLVRTEKEKEAENIRLRISRDIHDEVGATLSGVALYSEIAKQKMLEHKEEDAGEYLQYISDNSKEMVEKMSDIVWTINPKNDSFDRIIAKLESYAMKLCAGKGIQLYFEIDVFLQTYSPPMQVRKNIYLLLKEAINNAVKYSAAKSIQLSMKMKEELILVKLQDDGRGFDKEKVMEGNGISNMEARAKDLGASLNIQTNPGNGTTISFQFQIHPIEVLT